MITANGKTELLGYLTGNGNFGSFGPLTSLNFALGTGTTPAAASDTSLENQLNNANGGQVLFAPTTQVFSTVNSPGDTLTLSGQWVATVAATITEEALVGGPLIARQVLATPITVAVNDIVTLTHSVTIDFS